MSRSAGAVPTPSAAATEPATDAAPHRGLRAELGPWALGAMAFGGMIGSGWLFGAYYAAQVAGPAALLSWPVAGVSMLVLGAVLARLAATRPRAGGMVRWPQESHGRLLGLVIAWSILLAVASALAAEASGIVQYASHYLPWLWSDGRISGWGRLVAVGVLVGLTAVNWLGVALFARINGAVTAFKLVVPVLTVVTLLIAHADPDNLTAHGGMAPAGVSAALGAVATAGIVYAMNGFAAPIEMSAEARRPGRDIHRAIVVAIVASTVLYTLLQLAFLLAVPASALAGGWSQLSFDSPFGQLATLMGLGWLASLLYADAVVSPLGAASVFVAFGARETVAAAHNGLLPAAVAGVHLRSGVPRRALLLNLAIACAFVLPAGGWQDIIGFVGVLSLFGYAASCVSCASFEAAGPGPEEGAARARWAPPVGFAISTLLVFWAGWDYLHAAVPLLVVPVVVWAVRGGTRVELRGGGWLLGHLVGVLVISWVGSFGGRGWLPAPWDTVAVATLALAVFPWAVRSGVAYRSQALTSLSG